MQRIEVWQEPTTKTDNNAEGIEKSLSSHQKEMWRSYGQVVNYFTQFSKGKIAEKKEKSIGPK